MAAEGPGSPALPAPEDAAGENIPTVDAEAPRDSSHFLGVDSVAQKVEPPPLHDDAAPLLKLLALHYAAR